MCGRTICLLILILGLAGPAMAQDWDLEIPSVNKPPVLDGEVDPIWSIASVQYIRTTIEGTVTSPEDCSGSWRAMWDAEYIYVIVDVNDDSKRNDSGSAYLDDSVEFYFDGGNSKGPGSPLSGNDRQYTFGWTATDIQGTNTNISGVEHAQVDTATGWRIEMRLPWVSLQGTAPVMGDLIGIDVFINDDDDGADSREAQIATYGNDSGDWQVPSDWGTAVLVKGSSERASGPDPADGATDVPREAVLTWAAGEFAATHDVYFGTSLNAVSTADRATQQGVLVSQDQTDALYDPDGLLEYGQTYYWRVDEVNGPPDHAIATGEVWRFTAEPFAYPIQGIQAAASTAQPGMGPENTINGSGLNDNDEHSTTLTEMWMTTNAKPHWVQYEFDKVYKLDKMLVWNSNQLIEAFLGFGAKSVTVEYSADGTAWTVLEGVPEFSRATATPTYAANTTVDFGGVMAKFVKLSINANWGGLTAQTGLSEVRFFYVPVQAYQPQPTAAATGVLIDTDLAWRAGREAESHKVYLGTDQNALVLVDTTAEQNASAGSLNFGTAYFWKVDEIGGAGPYEGDVWTFTTQEYAAIDDFEGYNDDDNRIYDAWIDGLTTGASGSQVGYDVSPFAEKKTVHGGKQAMPLIYDNSAAPFLSEAERTFDAPQNWTVGAADSLLLYFQGNMPAFVETAPGTVLMNGLGTDVWNNADQFRYAYKTLNGNGTMVTRVDSLFNSNAWAKGGVMIRQNTEPGSTHAFMALTPGGTGGGNGASFQRRLLANGASTNNDSTTVVGPPYWVKVERNGNNFTGAISPDGKTWTQLGTAQTITMNGPVLIGLALCSHDANISTGAEFSSIAFTGNVTGNWQVAEIGAVQLAGNSVEGLYITIKDNSGKSATVANPDAAATVRTGWQAWRIPLSEFTAAGVKMNAVKSMVIGVGNKAAPAKGGAGTLFIDDLGFGKPIADQ